MNELSIYVHIPFCARKCLYCDFLSFYADANMIESYFCALDKEISVASKMYSEYEVISIFIGGGTPSFVDSRHITALLRRIKELYKVREDAEITIEVNPASALYEKLVDYRNAGINRLSIGAQSLDDAELRRLGRIHDSSLFYEIYENARKAGFDNINVDVMSALPDQSFESYMSTLEKVVNLRPEHISAYSLIVEEGTPFFDMELNLPDEDTDRQMYHETKRFLETNGYHRYEISNYAYGPGSSRECLHNKVYWQRGNYLGVGIGAASMVENRRWSNTGDIKEYLSAPEAAASDVAALGIDEQMEEFMFLGLRLIEGVSTKNFCRLFGKRIEEVYGGVIDKYEKLGLLERNTDEYIRLTTKGLDVSNTVMADFLL